MSSPVATYSVGGGLPLFPSPSLFRVAHSPPLYHRCLQSLVRPSCPLCRTPFYDHDVRRLHVDKATLPSSTPLSYPPDLESVDRARQFQTQLTRMIRGGATASDLYEVQSELKPWLSTQEPDDVRQSATS